MYPAARLTTLALIAQVAVAQARDDRTISFFHIHTNETLTILYKKDGTFVPEALEKINWIMRDWRVGKSITIDPNTVDIIWEMHRELGSQQPISIICGYRSPSTNEMLRKTRGGQASKSQHMTGSAIDLAFPDVPLERMRYSAMIRERGGVAIIRLGIPFVHVDTSRVRHWPRMPQDELAILFPNGSRARKREPLRRRAPRVSAARISCKRSRRSASFTTTRRPHRSGGRSRAEGRKASGRRLASAATPADAGGSPAAAAPAHGRRCAAADVGRHRA